MENELDGIPKKTKRMQLSVAGWVNGGVAMLFLGLFLRCVLWGSGKDKEMSEYLKKELEKQYEKNDRKLETADRKITPQIEETQRKLDSMLQKIDSIHKSTGI